MIGFPGEEEQDFEDTLQLMREVRFDDAFTYRYNPREGTKAFGMPGEVPEATKLARLDRVIELQRSTTQGRRRQRLGRCVDVLVEGSSKKRADELLARTEGNEMVVFPGVMGKIGTMTRVELVALEGATFRGKEILH